MTTWIFETPHPKMISTYSPNALAQISRKINGTVAIYDLTAIGGAGNASVTPYGSALPMNDDSGTLSVKFPKPFARQVKVACAQSDMTLRDFVREALEDKMRKLETEPQAA